MGHKDDSAAEVAILRELLQALALEVAVTNGEDFIHEEDVAVGVDGDAEGEADLHAATVVLEFLVDEALQLGEGDDAVELLVDLLLGETEDGRIQVDIVPAGEFRIETDAQFEEGRDEAVHMDLAVVGTIDAGQDLEEGRLARAVSTDDTEELPLLHLEGDLVQGLEGLETGRMSLELAHENTAERGDLLVRDLEYLGDIVYLDGDVLVHMLLSIPYFQGFSPI